MPARNRVLLAAIASILLVVWQLHVSSKVGALFGDFRAFYCAGAALAHGANPYAAASIYSCEQTPMPLGLYHALPGVAVPAPLPGYALLLFVPLGVLPYVIACMLWLIVLLASCALCVRALALLLECSIDAAICALAVGFAVIVIPFGELGSVVMAAVLWMAVALRQGAWTWAAVAGGFAMILPHVGLPAVLGAFLFVPNMRTRIVALAAMLVLLDVLAGGVHTALDYVTTVLPAHARSEIGSTAQFGLTWMLHGLGAGDRSAIAGGELCYGVMVILGVFAARAICTRLRDVAYVSLIPPAFAVFGGTFIHFTQITIAIPAALLLAFHSRGMARGIFTAASLLLLFPWLWVLGQPVLIVVYALGGAFVARLLFNWDATIALRIALASALLTGLILIAGYHFGAGLSTHVHGVTLQQGLAQSSWGEYVRAQRSSTGMAWWIAKAPTWIGLLLLTLGCAYALMKEDFVPPVAVKEMPVAT